ncbi:hypothetical protein CMUS01_02639 [Colletotrichum musicola]|uniref:Uncharacterized protein n=1 Tax=Colletotrichum musicola TaxID=2175873 RepID=A0A8H6U6Y6_9PEZI|nr:hypothetical protein CMUS01_02639 [Colletotrichum musicola]
MNNVEYGIARPAPSHNMIPKKEAKSTNTSVSASASASGFTPGLGRVVQRQWGDFAADAYHSPTFGF